MGRLTSFFERAACRLIHYRWDDGEAHRCCSRRLQTAASTTKKRTRDHHHKEDSADLLVRPGAVALLRVGASAALVLNATTGNYSASLALPKTPDQNPTAASPSFPPRSPTRRS